MADGDKTTDFLNMSDDDFLRESPPEVTEKVDTAVTEKEPQGNPEANSVEGTAETEEKTAEELAAEAEAASAAEAEAKKAEGEDNDSSGDTDKSSDKTGDNDTVTKPDSNADDKTDKDKVQPDGKDATGKTDIAPKEGETQKAEPSATDVKPVTPEDHKTFYEKIIGVPLQANGKKFTVKNSDEAIRLIQGGLGFMKKMQDIQPHLKVIRTLEKAGILDPDKIAFLVDLNDKNPEAIKKLVKESGIDPLDLNVEGNIDYKPTNRANTTDGEVEFGEALNELKAHPKGLETINEINGWDQRSKNALFATPALLKVIQDQKDTGIYPVISSEIDRRKTLGQIDPKVPFLEAYKLVGDELKASGALESLITKTDTTTKPATAERVVVDSRVAVPDPKVANNDKVAAAAATKTNGKTAGTKRNPLEMPDDEFMKQLEGRL